MIDIKRLYFKKNNFEISIEFGDMCKVTQNGKKKIVKSEIIIEYIIKITYNWKSEYINRSYIDGDSWTLVIDNKKIIGHAAYSSNFNLLERQLGMIISNLVQINGGKYGFIKPKFR